MNVGSPGIKASDVWAADPGLLARIYAEFTLCVDDFEDAVVGGTSQTPAQMFDNDTALPAKLDAIGEYVELELGGSVYVKEFRYYGYVNHAQDGLNKVVGWVNGAWVDLHVDIPTRLNSWSAWTTLTTPAIVTKLRVEATALDTTPAPDMNWENEWEFRGFRLG